MTVSELITILSFLALAALTAWYAYQTQQLAAQSERAAEAAQRSAESAERMLQLEFLPIVWGRRGVLSSTNKGASVGVTASNAGRGAALNVSCWVVVGRETVAPRLIANALDPHGRRDVNFSISNTQHKEIRSEAYSIICEYHDPAGRKYQTRVTPTDAVIVEIGPDGSERALLV